MKPLNSNSNIVLTTLNARYMHTAFGLRYLYANLGDLQSQTCIEEFTIHERPIDIVEKLLKHNPRIIGIGVYIWNATEIAQTVRLLKKIAPEVIIVLGGPEVSHPPDLPHFTKYVDYIVTGAGENSFLDLCIDILSNRRPIEKIITGVELALNQLALPYAFYTDEDIRNRMMYVEASRGCPFKCEFCLSSLDKTSKPFELTAFLNEMGVLFDRGARNFKFIDRTFNLKVSTSIAILEFFLERMTTDLYLHFEVIPDNLPDKLKLVLEKFPKHSLQFEIGVQTFDPEIQQRISRRQDNKKTCDNLIWLRQNTEAYIHADLIFGLPGDTLENFSHSFNQLYALNPHEIQLGILKRLRGAPINRHSDEYKLQYNPEPPYNILSTRDVDFETMQRVNRYARYWGLIGNSGRFKATLSLLLANDSFNQFMLISDEIYKQVGTTWKISLKNLFVLLYESANECFDFSSDELMFVLEKDYLRSGEKAKFEHLFVKKKKDLESGIANKRQKIALL